MRRNDNSWALLPPAHDLPPFPAFDAGLVLGHLFTIWSKLDKLAEWPPLAANAGLVTAPAGVARPTAGTR